jgi:RNA polymerase sigma-70 factor (ECF subfamily)
MINTMTDLIQQTQAADSAESIQQRFLQNDPAVFDDLVACYLSPIRSLVHRLLVWEADVDDIAQDVFIAAYTKRKTFRAQSSLKTWLYSIAINQCRSRNRKQLLRRKLTMQQPITIPPQEDGPAAASMTQERIEQIRQAVKQLPGRYRDVIVLKYLEELPTKQILDILKMNEKAFYTRLSRARNKLQKSLSEYWESNDE